MLSHAVTEPKSNVVASRKGQKTGPFFSPVAVQPKFEIGPLNDPFEREADEVANRVMRVGENEVLQTKTAPVAIRKCVACERGNALQHTGISIQRKCAACREKDKNLRRKEKECTKPVAVELKNSREVSLENYTTGGGSAGVCALMDVKPAVENICPDSIHEEVKTTKGTTCPPTIITEPCKGNSVFPTGKKNRGCPYEVTPSEFYDRHTIQVPHESILHDDKRNPKKLKNCELVCDQIYFGKDKKDILGHFVINYHISSGRRDGQNITDINATKKPADEKTIKRKCAACAHDEKNLFRKETGEASHVTDSIIIEKTLQSPGQPLDPHTRSFMESRFGHDFGNVRVHDDSPAHQSAAEINALAFTYKNHIVFGKGQYQPRQFSGRKLLAHELTHVIQQNKAGQKPELRKDNDPKPVDYKRPVPLFFNYEDIKGVLKDATKNTEFDYYFIIQGNYVKIYNEKELIVDLNFERKSSLDLAGYFVNFRTEEKTFWSNLDSWWFVRDSDNKYDTARLVTYMQTYEETSAKSKVSAEPRYQLSKQLFDVLQDMSPRINLTTLSISKFHNVYNIGLAILAPEPSEGGSSDIPRPAPRYQYALPAWFSQLENRERSFLEEAKKVKESEQHLPDRLVFYGSSVIQKREGKDSWMIQVEKGKEMKFIKVNKTDWGKAPDKEKFARKIWEDILNKVEQVNKESRLKEFDKQEEQQNKVKEAKGSKWAWVFTLRNQVWDGLVKLKTTNPFITDIPDKLTVEFFGAEPDTQAVFKIWLEQKTAAGQVEMKGAALERYISSKPGPEFWIKLIRKQTEIQRLILSGVDSMEFANYEKEKVNSEGKIQLAPFPAEIEAKDLNPDFTTVKGAKNEFYMSLNWDAIYRNHDALSTASRISSVKKSYNFQIIPLPDEILKKKKAGDQPSQLMDESNEYIRKFKPVTPFDNSTDIERDPEYDIAMDQEGSFLLISYAFVKEEGEKAPRAMSAAAHPYFVTDINLLADKTAKSLDVVATLKHRLETEKNPKNRALIEEQIRDTEKRQEKGYAAQATEDINDIEKLIVDATQLLQFITDEKKYPAYGGDFEYDPFSIRLKKKKPELQAIYDLIKGKRVPQSYSDDESMTREFIEDRKRQKIDLGKLARRVEDPSGKFKKGAKKFKALAVSVNEDNGRIVPLMLLIGEHEDSDPAKNEYKHIILDVTIDSAKKSDMLYVGEGTKATEEESVKSAFVKFGEKNNYGDGKVAYRVPARNFSGVVRSYTTVWEWIEKALLLVALVLLAFGVILSGGALAPAAAAILGGVVTALGVSAGILGAIIGARNILDRREKGTLEMDAQTSMDIISIIGAFTGGVLAGAKIAAVEISETLIVAYEITDFGGNVWLIHTKLNEDLRAINELPIDEDEKKPLREQAMAEAQQQGAILFGTGVGSKLFHANNPKAKDLIIPDELQEQLGKTKYKSFKGKGWIDKDGLITEKAPPYLKEMRDNAIAKNATQPSPKETDQKPAEPSTSKTRVKGTPLPEPAEPAKSKAEEPRAINPEDSKATKHMHVGQEDHDVVVSEDGVGICSGPPCVNIGVEYKEELDADKELTRKNNRIQELRREKNFEQASNESELLIVELEAARAKRAKVAAAPQERVEPGSGAPAEKTKTPAEPVSAKDSTGTTGPKQEPEIRTQKAPSQEAINEANDWELIAGSYDQDAESHLDVAREEQAKAAKFRAEDLTDEAAAAEKRAASATNASEEAKMRASEARENGNALRNGREGLTYQQLQERQELTAKRNKLKAAMEAKGSVAREKQTGVNEAKEQLETRRNELEKLQDGRVHNIPPVAQMSEKKYRGEVQDLKEKIERLKNSIKQREKSSEAATRSWNEEQRNFEKVSRRLNDLADLEKGLSENNKNAKGDYAEAKADEKMSAEGFEKIGQHSIPQGIDRIYRKIGSAVKNIIAEIKYVQDAKRYLNNPEAAKRDLLKNTNDGPQLSDQWTDRRILDAVKNNEQLADEIRANHEKWLMIYDAKTRQFISAIPVD